MTMRNAVPRFGMRAAVVLAFLAVVALAALLAVGSPASAQTQTGDEIWSETLTAGVRTVNNEDIYRGYWQTDIFDLGSLTGGDLDTGRRGYPIHILSESIFTDLNLDTAGRRLWFGPGIRNRASLQLNRNELKSMTLHVEGQSFAFEDASESVDDDVGFVYAWPLSSSFGWADGDTVAVSITAVPVVYVVPPRTESGQSVEFGKVAEFIFNRIGSTDEALSFTVLHNQSGETATRTFEAGQSSFSNYHWAIDRDEDNNPVCIIQWQVQPGDGYVPGEGFTGETGFVVVEGPGTTCMGGI